MVAAEHAAAGDAAELISAGWVTVDGIVVTNPRSVPRATAAVTVRPPRALRGEAKLRAALALFDVAVAGRVALDVGAAAGGFTRVLLAAGARRVYAVDAGHGQLLGSLRADPRVINLEATNVSALDRRLIGETVDVVTVDVSYLSLRDAVAQLDRVALDAAAELVGLVKPTFELRLATPPAEEELLVAALRLAAEGVERCGWSVVDTAPSPVRGAGGSREMLLHARRA